MTFYHGFHIVAHLSLSLTCRTEDSRRQFISAWVFGRGTTCVYFVGSGTLQNAEHNSVLKAFGSDPGELRQMLTQVRLDDPGHLQVGEEISTHAEPV